MNKKVSIDSRALYRVLFLLILLMGLFARLYKFGLIPEGIAQDEAFAGYEAYSLLHFGVDSSGHHFPVYLVAWGSGMNALNSYLMIPFLAIWGLETWVIRIPQVIVGILTIVATYFMVKKLCSQRIALIAMFTVAISPWLVLLSRWGLESNLTPGFLVFSLLFFVYGLDNPRLLPVSALFYGLSLYCYATIWPFVPIIIGLQVLYGIYCKKITFNKYIVISFIILGLLAAPLILFIFVNWGLIEDINLPFFSIPRLLYMRQDEFTISNIIPNLKTMLKVILYQKDGITCNTPGKYGFFYKCSLPFMAIGFVGSIIQAIRHIKSKVIGAEVFLVIHSFAGILLGLTISIDGTRDNLLFTAITFLIVAGICYTCKYSQPILLYIICFAYLVQFGQFEYFYFTEYRENIAFYFNYGLEDCLDIAINSNKEIHISPNILYPRVLFYTKQPVDEFLATVKYTNYPADFLKPESFGDYSFVCDTDNLDSDSIYILNPYFDDPSPYENAGFTVEEHGYMLLAYN